MADRRWCPDCRETVWRFDDTSDGAGACDECGSRMVGLPWRIKTRILVGRAVAYAVAIAFLLGPPVGIVYYVIANWGRPLIELREVTTTTTQVHGILPNISGIFLVWLVILMFAYMMVSGIMPGRV